MLPRRRSYRGRVLALDDHLVAVAAGLALQWLARADDHRVSEPQKVPFLGGGSPQVHAWQRYHVRYYSMTLLFIAFEMEMMFKDYPA